MNREDIIKALECCAEDTPYPNQSQALLDTITFIKQLTEENERWKAIPEQLHKEMSEQMIEERKIERKLAVSQIIGEILSRHTSDIDGFITIHVTELAELKKKYIGENNG
jgi:hypothetical protein